MGLFTRLGALLPSQPIGSEAALVAFVAGPKPAGYAGGSSPPVDEGPAFGTVLRRRRLLWRTLRAWEALLWCAAALAAALIVPLRYAIGQNADGLLQTLMSIQHLTIFFWQQDRFANLLPLLASPVADPVANAQFQLVLRIGFGVAAPLLFCVSGGSWQEISQAARATLLASALALAAAPQQILHEWFVEASPYGTSFALGGFALLLFALAPAHKRGTASVLRLTGLLLTVAAYLVNASLVLLALPLFGTRALLFGVEGAAEFCVASIVGILMTLLVSSSVHAHRTLLGFGESLAGLQFYATELAGRPGAFLLSMVALFLLAALLGRGIGHAAFVRDGLLLLGTAVVVFLAVSLSAWVQFNRFHPRYLVPVYVLVMALGAKVVLRLLGRLCARGTASVAALGLCAALLMVAGCREATFVGDENGIVHADSLPLARAVAGMVAARRLDAVAGDYWQVWPSVFLAEQRAHEAGRRPGGVFGLAPRGDDRRAALLAHLATGALTVACIDLTDEACRDTAARIVREPLQVQPSGESRGVDGHRVSVVTLVEASP